jgi:glycolate oxidase
VDYAKVTSSTVEELASIVGAENVRADPETLKKYSRDETPRTEGALPDVVVLPGDTQEVSKTLAYANDHRIPVTFRGQGTGLSCGAVPLLGGILMTFERMNKILEIDDPEPSSSSSGRRSRNAASSTRPTLARGHRP